MKANMIIACAAIVGIGFLPDLPPFVVLIITLLVAVAALLVRRFRLLLPLCLGVFWGAAYGYLTISQQLPAELEGVDLWVEGEISGLPRRTDLSQRFEFDIKHIALPDGRKKRVNLGRVRINWYQTFRSVKPGERWRLQLRLKRAHGFANPGGFDYEGWLFRQAIGATGYVRRHEHNQRLATAGSGQLLDQWRYGLLQRLRAQLQDNPNKGLLLALLMGERTDISAQQWQLLSTTGTNHLFVISGLHVGFVALCAYFVFFHLSRLLLLGPPRIAAQQLGAAGALLSSCFYAAMAGFSLPTQRALIMLLVMLLGRICRRRINVWHSFTLALLLVLLWDPLAAHAAGFWLSFGAVGSLLYAFSQRTVDKGFWWRWVRPQWVVFVAFFPVLLFFFQQVSLVSPAANLLAIPFVGFIVVPLCLLVVLLELLTSVLPLQWLASCTGLMLQLASSSFELIFDYLKLLAALPWAKWGHALSLWFLLPALAGVLLLLAPRGLPARWLGVVCLVPLLVGGRSGPQQGQFEVTVLDVGQGLAVLVRTAEHQLLYDVGAQFSPNFDAANAVVLPYLRQQGIAALDRVVISHGDNDHAGALPMLIDGVAVAEVVFGSASIATGKVSQQACEDGQAWQWDKVSFKLMQADASTWHNENNRSCVLKVSSDAFSVLLTGDIEVEAETALLGQYGSQLKADVLLAPHHGSRSSSSQTFVDRVAPEWVIFSSGYRNRFGHPHEKVVARYSRRNIAMLNTQQQGAIRVYFHQDEARPVIEKYRETFKRYWF